jgi:hypothetical protein
MSTGGSSIFRFVLRPLDEVAPWGGPERPSLSWFGLSDGWYWLALGDEEVLRAREDGDSGTDPDEPPYADHYVARLWEDVLGLLPAALERVPEDVARVLRDVLLWERGLETALTSTDGAAGERLYDAASWWGARELDLGQMVQAPRVHVWRRGDAMHIRWDSRPGDVGPWRPVHGELSMDVAAFLEEVRAFTGELLAQMGARVDALVAAGGMPGVRLDLDALVREQQQRRAALLEAQRSVARHPPTDWNAVRALVRSLHLG